MALTGVFSITRSATPGPDGRIGTADDVAGLQVAATKVSLFVGDPGATTGQNDDTGLRITDGTALLLLGGAGFAGHVSGAAALYLGSGVAASASLVSLDLNQRGVAVDQELLVDGRTQRLVLPQGPYVKVAVTGLSVAFAGQQLVTDLSIEKTSTTLKLEFAHLALSLGPVEHPVVLVRNGSGRLDILTGGVAGTISVDLALDVPGVGLSGTFTLAINTTGATRNGIAAGLLVSGTGVVLQVAGQSLTGAFTVQQNSSTKKVVLVLDMTLALGNGTETFLSARSPAPSWWPRRASPPT